MGLGVGRVREIGRFPAAPPLADATPPRPELPERPLPAGPLRPWPRPRAADPARVLLVAECNPSEFGAALEPAEAGVSGFTLLLPSARGIELPAACRPCAGVVVVGAAPAAVVFLGRGFDVRLGGAGIARRREEGTSLSPPAIWPRAAGFSFLSREQASLPQQEQSNATTTQNRAFKYVHVA